MTRSAWLNEAGGLRYHLRALRYAKSLWQPYRWALGEWLLGWEVQADTLVLVGPSGGYCLQPFLFERFERIVCLEPDPLAGALFARSVARAPIERRPRVEIVREDKLVQHPERFVPWLEAEGQAAVLFSNIIGQLCVLHGVDERADDPRLEAVRTEVQRALVGRAWASFHDRVSGYLRPSFEQPLHYPSRASDAEVLQDLFSVADLPENTEVELVDHLT
jgi:hypothetical protein